eukprot:1864522-Rhodomonas_salina.1
MGKGDVEGTKAEGQKKGRRGKEGKRSGLPSHVWVVCFQVDLSSPNTSHEDSDDCAAIILGDEEKRPNYDNKVGVP